MIKSLRVISNNLVNRICRSFENNYDFKSLIENYPYLDYYVLYSILYGTGKYNDELYDCLCQVNIDDRKILIISDTHYGSIYEDFNYTYEAFNFAIRNGIHTILHGGDIIESNFNRRSECNIVAQADYFINRYPFVSGISTYALLGNHDYSAIRKKEKIRSVLESRDDINILGFKKTYIKWRGNVISLQHDIHNFKLKLPVNAEYLAFKGHSHFYHVAQKKGRIHEKIYIPSMCSDPVYYVSNPQLKAGDVRPGFLTAEIADGNIIVTNYSFTGDDIVKENEFKKVLKR